MIRISKVAVSGICEKGSFSGELTFAPGLNIFSAHNAYGKSLAVTSIAWCLGLEGMFGLRNDDPSRYPDAVRALIDLDGERDLRVTSATAALTLERDDGTIITLSRPIVGDSPEFVTMTEAMGKTARLYARKGTMADESGGLQRFLYDWAGWPRRELVTGEGGRGQIYLENIAPHFYIDQNEGWTDLQALQVYRYGLQDIAQASVEYLLAADQALAHRLSDQQVVAQHAKQKAEAELLAQQVVALFHSQGWTLKWSTHGNPIDIARRWSDDTLSEIARAKFHMDYAAEQARLTDHIRKLEAALSMEKLDPKDARASSESSQRVVDLKSKRHELRSLLRIARTQLTDEEGLRANLSHRIKSSKDVLRLKQQNIGRLEHVECPTCHRDIAPEDFHLTDQSAESVAAHIDALTRDASMLDGNLESLRAEVWKLSTTISTVENELRSAEQGLATVNAAVGSVREQLGKIATDLSAARYERERTTGFFRQLMDLQAAIDTWCKSIKDAEVAGAESGDDLGKRLAIFTGHLRQQLLGLGHSAVTPANVAEVRLDDRYVPFLGARRLRSLGSASDHPRLVAAYAVALAQAAKSLAAPHPGFVVLDEPLQQNPDDDHRNFMLRFLETTAKDAAHQLVIFTFLHKPEVTRLKTAKVNVRVLDGEHFLKLEPPPPPPPPPEKPVTPSNPSKAT